MKQCTCAFCPEVEEDNNSYHHFTLFFKLLTTVYDQRTKRHTTRRSDSLTTNDTTWGRRSRKRIICIVGYRAFKRIGVQGVDNAKLLRPWTHFENIRFDSLILNDKEIGKCRPSSEKDRVYAILLTVRSTEYPLPNSAPCTLVEKTVESNCTGGHIVECYLSEVVLPYPPMRRVGLPLSEPGCDLKPPGQIGWSPRDIAQCRRKSRHL